MTGAALDDKRVLPAAIEATLRRLIWRVRLAITVRGALATLVAVLGGILLAMGIAARWPVYEPWQHYALTLLWVAAGAGAGAWTLLHPLARSFTLAGIARVLEQRHPELNERVSSAVELLTSADAPEIRGSEALIRALAEEASSDVASVQPRREFTFHRARPFMIATGVAVAVIAGLLAAYPRQVGRLLAKTVVPVLNLPNVHADDLEIAPGDRVAVEGQRLEVSVRLRNVKVPSAEFRLARASGGDLVTEMAALSDGAFTHTTSPLVQTIRYRIRAGEAVSRYYTVTVVPRPKVARVEVGYEYPAYTLLPDVAPTSGSGKIEAPVGTLATVRVYLNKPVASAEATINGDPVALERLDATTYAFAHRLEKFSTGAWRVALTDEHGFSGEPAEYAITAVADAPPAARIVSPHQETLKLKPTDRLPVQYSLADDFGFSRAELLVTVDAQAVRAAPAPTTGPAGAVATPDRPGRVATEAMVVLDLATLELSGARKVTCQVRALDNRPDPFGGPQEGLSATRTIELDVKAPDYVYQVQLALDLTVRETLKKIYEDLKKAKAISEPLRRSMPATTTLSSETVGKVDQMRSILAGAEDDSHRLAAAAGEGLYPKLAQGLTDLADNHIGKARELAGLIKITDQQKARAELSDEADFQIDRALAIVSDLLKEFDVMTDLARRALALEDLAERQADLAQALSATQPAEIVPTSAPAVEAIAAEPALGEKDWQQAQRQVAHDTAQVAGQVPGAMRQALQDQQRQTRDLAGLADQLQRAQQDLMKSAAAAQQIAELAQRLSQMAARQEELAGRAGEMARQAAPVMPASAPADLAARQARSAAQALAATRPAEALQAQSATIEALEQTVRAAQQELQRQAAAQLAEAAERLAQQEDDLARTSRQSAARQDSAQQAQRDLTAAQSAQKEALTGAQARLAELVRRQAAVARQAQPLEASSSPPEAARPTALMNQAAAALEKANPQAAQEAADQAARQARALSGELARHAAASQPSAEQGAQVAQQARAAEQVAKDQEQLAKDIAAAARQEAPKLAAADQAARQAAAEGERTGQSAQRAAKDLQAAVPQQRQLAQQVPQLRTLAGQGAPELAAAMKRLDPAPKMSTAVSELQRSQPAKAAEAQESAAEQLRQLARTAREQLTADPAERAAQELAAAAERLAHRQDQLAGQADQAAGLQQSAQADRQAGGERAAQAEQSARQAAEQTRDVGRQQQDLGRQAEGLRDVARQGTPQAQAAMARHDPSANMQQAAAALGENRPDQAAPAQRSAAEQLRQLAQAARSRSPGGDVLPLGASPPAPISPSEPAAQTARAAGELAAQQRQLQQQASELARELARLQGQQEQQELRRLQAEQHRLARETGELADDVKAQAPQPDRVETQAARAAEQAAQEIAAGQLPQAAQSGRQAASTLNELAGRLGSTEHAEVGRPAEQGRPGAPEQGEPGAGERGQGEPNQGEPGQGEPGQGEPGQGEPGQGEPGQGQPGQGRSGQGQPGQGQPGRSGQVQAAAPSGAQEPQQVAAEQGPSAAQQRQQLAGRADDLAGRQQRVADELAALSEHQLPQVLASRQQGVHQGTQEVQDGTELIGEHAEELLPGTSAQQLAQQAAAALQQASASQQQAEQAMRSGLPGPSVPMQQTSAAALGQAAQALRALGQQFAQQAARSPAATPEGQSMAEEMAGAVEATQGAAQSQQVADAALAAEMLAALARQAAQQAQANGVMPAPGTPTGTQLAQRLTSNARVGRAAVDLSEAELRALGITSAEWARLPGELRDQVLQAARVSGPEEYRALVKRYFQAIARSGSAEPSPGGGPAPEAPRK